jgi:hypothetical protein
MKAVPVRRTPAERAFSGPQAIVYWNTISIQRALDDPDGDELAGLTPTTIEHVNPLGTYDFSAERPADSYAVEHDDRSLSPASPRARSIFVPGATWHSRSDVAARPPS